MTTAPETTGACSCRWAVTAGVTTMQHRDADCPRHGDGTRWWNRLLARLQRTASLYQRKAN